MSFTEKKLQAFCIRLDKSTRVLFDKIIKRKKIEIIMFVQIKKTFIFDHFTFREGNNATKM